MTPDFLATHLKIVFHESEDRLVILASNTTGKQDALMLTRRLTARLINGLAAILEQSNIAASKASDDLRNDIILMEHQVAIAVGQPSSEGVTGQPGKLLPLETTQLRPRLVSKVNIMTNPLDFHVVLQGAHGAPVGLVVNRVELHRVVEVLKRQAEGAGWNLQIDANWLGDDQGQLTLN